MTTPTDSASGSASMHSGLCPSLRTAGSKTKPSLCAVRISFLPCPTLRVSAQPFGSSRPLQPNVFHSFIFPLYLAGLLYITFTKGSTAPSNELYAVEVWIVLSLCLIGVCSGQFNRQGRETRDIRICGCMASSTSWVIQLGFWIATIYYAIWYIYIGMDGMATSPCGSFVFFFAKVVMRSPFICA
jgi:hypothetical protein